MKNLLKLFLQIWIRFRYPVSTPSDLAADLGFDISDFISFDELICYLTTPQRRPSKLCRLMPREDAEKIFQLAIRKEKFQQNSLFSYHINGNWMEFVLDFDDNSKLRRLYIRHKHLKHKHEISITP